MIPYAVQAEIASLVRIGASRFRLEKIAAIFVQETARECINTFQDALSRGEEHTAIYVLRARYGIKETQT